MDISDSRNVHWNLLSYARFSDLFIKNGQVLLLASKCISENIRRTLTRVISSFPHGNFYNCVSSFFRCLC
jgi:hypothetical protein